MYMIILTEDNVSIIISFLITSTLVRLPVEDEPLLYKNLKKDLGEAEAGIVTGDRCDCAKFASPFEECTKDSLLGWLTVWQSPF